MKKYLLGFFKKKSIIKLCSQHNIKKYPNVKSNESCLSCNEDICYMCGDIHFNNKCNVQWGIDIIPSLKSIDDDKNVKFNQGYPFILDLVDLKCPCGTEILESVNSTICSSCGTATCSESCHEKFLENENMCLFHTNFLSLDSPKEILQAPWIKVSGMRTIKILDILKSIDREIPKYKENSLSNSKYIKSYAYENFKIILQRGFRQYGQPHINTLKNMTLLELIDDESKLLYEEFSEKLCLCDCEKCENRSPHPISNCTLSCLKVEEINENEKLKYRLYDECKCTCTFCIYSGKHLKEDCAGNCDIYKKMLI